MLKKILAVVELTRPINAMITFAVVFVSTIICSDLFEFSNEIVLACFSAMFVAASGNVINDFFDYTIDIINKPNRPIPSGRITKNGSIIIYVLLVLVSVILSLFISLPSFAIVVFTITLLFFYSLSLKKIPLIGNISIALSTALAFIYGGVVVGNIDASLIPASFAFLINLIREIVKDVEDREGDAKNNIETYPLRFGINKTVFLLTALLMVLFFLTILPFYLNIYSIEYFLMVMFCVNLPLVYFYREITSKRFLNELSRLSLLLKATMVFGLLAIYLG